MVNINNLYVCIDWIAIYCLLLIELMLNWLNYLLMLIIWWIEIECWLCELILRSDEMKVIVMNYFEIECFVDKWLICGCCENYVEVECDEMRNEMLRYWLWKNELSYWDCGFESVMNWIELLSYVNCMCLMVMSWLF